jgi:transcriptional regulator with XRE-family HTH domain
MEPKEDRRRLGAAIVAAREAAGMTQADLGGLTRLGQPMISRIEAGTRRVTSHELARLAGALGVEIGVLMGTGGGGDYLEQLRRLDDADMAGALAWVEGFLDDMDRLEHLLQG